MSQPPPPEYKVYRSRRGLLNRRGPAGDPGPLPGAGRPGGGGRAPGRARRFGGRPSARRVLGYLALGVVAWLGLSLVVFLVSAQLQSGQVDAAADGTLGGGGFPPVAPTNILVLGSDTRSQATAEPGSSTSGPGRSDSILLLRVGGGHNGRLSIARDTLVQIPGQGVQKINAAYSIGGASLAVQTVEDYLGIEVNHLIEVSFENFPELIDAMGGITYEGACVIGRVNGGYRNGGVTVRVPGGEPTQLNGREALALARTRRNECRPNENDLSRARRQQKIIGAMKSKMLSPSAFVRLPLIAWNAPKAIRSDMSGPTLLGVFAALAVSGSPPPQVLGTSSGAVPDGARERAVERFLDG